MALNQQLQLVQLVEAVGLGSVWKTLRKAEDLPISERLDFMGEVVMILLGEIFVFLNPRLLSLQFQLPKTSKLAERNGVVFSFFFFQWKWTFDRPIIYSTPIGDWCGFSM